MPKRPLQRFDCPPRHRRGTTITTAVAVESPIMCHLRRRWHAVITHHVPSSPPLACSCRKAFSPQVAAFSACADAGAMGSRRGATRRARARAQVWRHKPLRTGRSSGFFPCHAGPGSRRRTLRPKGAAALGPGPELSLAWLESNRRPVSSDNPTPDRSP